MGCTSRMATSFLPATVLRSSGECPCTSALGLFTRKYSAPRSNESLLSNTIVMALRSLCNRNSVGQGFDAPSFIFHFLELPHSSPALRAPHADGLLRHLRSS